MKTRPLGNSDLHITPIGFGAWALGGGDWQFGWGGQEDQDSVAAIYAALELGVNWIDTAAVYGLGHSEEVVARALADWRGARPYVFTKCGMVWDDQRKIDYSLREASIRRECEDSMRRLKTDVIDLYQIHWPADEMEETEEGWTTMAALQKEGKVRWIGASNFSQPELEHAKAIAPVTSLQPPYSLIKRDAEGEHLPWCEANQVGVIVYSPMASGLLTSAMSVERAAGLPADDWRSKNPEFQPPKLAQNLALAERLRDVAERHGRTAGQAGASRLEVPTQDVGFTQARIGKEAVGRLGTSPILAGKRNAAAHALGNLLDQGFEPPLQAHVAKVAVACFQVNPGRSYRGCVTGSLLAFGEASALLASDHDQASPQNGSFAPPDGRESSSHGQETCG